MPQSEFKKHKKPSVHFTQIPNILIRSKLGNSAFRLICYLASHQEDWKVYQEIIMKDLGWGREMLRGAIKELVEKKLMIVTQCKGESGKFNHNNYEWDYEPIEYSNNDSIGGKPVDGKPDIGESPTKNTSLKEDQYKEPNLTSCESSQVLSNTEKLRELPLKVIDVDSGTESWEHFTEPEIQKIVETYSTQEIYKAAQNVTKRKTTKRQNLGPIQSEKAYFLDSLKKFKSGVYK